MSDPQPSVPPAVEPLPGYPGSAAAPADVEQPPPDRLAEFRRTLSELTPHVYVTPALIGINAIVFAVMVASGVSLTDPTIADLLRWGADFGPSTTSGEWWRLLTCTFVHIGIVHIALNMWVLADAGPLVERMVGNVGFLVLYLASGLTGSVASLLWNPMLVSAGASGAIFGVYGALLAVLLRHRGSIPAEALIHLRNSGLGFLGYNLLYGMVQANVDSAAHLGGLAGGFVCGLVLSQPFAPQALAQRAVRNLLAAVLGMLLVLGGSALVLARHGQVAKVQDELNGFAAMEKKALDAYNDAIQKSQRKELTDAAFANIMEREVLPEWRAARERLSAFQDLPASLQSHLATVLDYMRLRQESWELFTEALRLGDFAKARQAMTIQKLADDAAIRISKGDK